MGGPGSRRNSKNKNKAKKKAARNRAPGGSTSSQDPQASMASPYSEGMATESQESAVGENVREDAVGQSSEAHIADHEAGPKASKEPVGPADEHHESSNDEIEREPQQTEQQHTNLGQSSEGKSADHQADLKASKKELDGPTEDHHQKSDAELEKTREEMEQQIEGLLKYNEELVKMFIDANDGRAQDSKTFDNQKRDLEREKMELQAKIDQLEDGNRGDSPSELDKIRQENAQYLNQLEDTMDKLEQAMSNLEETKQINTKLVGLLEKAKKESNQKYQDLLKAYNEETNKNAVLAEQVTEGLPRAWGNKDPSVMKRQLNRIKDELARSGGELAELRAENHRMNWGGFQRASEMLRNCSHLADLQAPVFQTMVAMAEYADGVPGSTAPTDKQSTDLRQFQEYLEERAGTLKTAMSSPDPGLVLDEFDDNWKDPFRVDDWGVICRLHVAVVKAASLIKGAKKPELYIEAVNEMNRFATEAEGMLGQTFPGGELVDEINDRFDELRRRRGE